MKPGPFSDTIIKVSCAKSLKTSLGQDEAKVPMGDFRASSNLSERNQKIVVSVTDNAFAYDVKLFKINIRTSGHRVLEKSTRFLFPKLTKI